MTRYITFALVVMAALGAAYVTGHRHGTAALQARLDAATVQAQAQAAETARALAVAEQKRARLAQALEDQASAEPVTVPVCLGPSRLRRINAAIAATDSPVPKP